MKDLFVGALGRLNNHGGSRIFTTPHTISVPPEYTVATDVPSVAEFVTCSLDGRLWVYRRSRRYYISAFRWDEDTQQLVFSASTAISNTNIIGRGIDWILTDTVIIQVTDDEPYIHIANLFSGDNTKFLYSNLRSGIMSEKLSIFIKANGSNITTPIINKVLGSGIDPFTKEAWGQSEDNGNSEGYGIFNRSALIHSVSKQYSMLPAVGDWNIIGNFLVRRPDNSLSNEYNTMINIRPLIPLEFNYYSEEIVYRGYSSEITNYKQILYWDWNFSRDSYPSYGVGYEHDISLVFFNGQIWGRGLMHIGRCYILPAVFNEDGTPEEFYLYISPDFLCSPYNLRTNPNLDSNNEWLNIGIICMNENSLYGFLCEQSDSLSDGLCLTSKTPKLFVPSSNDWQILSESGRLFLDPSNNSGLVLDDDSITLLNDSNLTYECKGIQRWIAPSGEVDAISPQLVISSFDNGTLATHIQSGFHRELIAGKTLPLSVSDYSGKRLSLNGIEIHNRKTIQGNSINIVNHTAPISWENIYKNAVEINKLTHPSGIHETGYSFQYDSYMIHSINIESMSGTNIYYPLFMKSVVFHVSFFFVRNFRDQPVPHVVSVTREYSHDMSNIDYDPYRDEGGYAAYTEVIGTATLFYFHPDTGEYHEFSVTASFPETIKQAPDIYDDTISMQDEVSIPYGIYVKDGELIWVYEKEKNPGAIYNNAFFNMEGYFFISLGTLPNEILNWEHNIIDSNVSKHLILSNLYIGNVDFSYIPEQYIESQDFPKNDYFDVGKLVATHNGIPVYLTATFRDYFSNTKFLYNLPSILDIDTNGKCSGSLYDLGIVHNVGYHIFFNNINTGTEEEYISSEALHALFFEREIYYSNEEFSHFEYVCCIFKTKLHPEIFDFQAEIERSKLF